jgi:antitoxin (DNA-binding transcriptional repressor) of toxin-antitoxin stability system
MKFITVRDLRTSPAQVWKQLPEEQEMVITNNGRPIALLTPLSDINLEETLKAIRSARAINAVRQMQMKSLKNKNNTLTEEEIENEIKETRKQKK